MNPSIEEVAAKHAPRLLAIPGVVSVGVGRGDAGAIIVVGLERERARRAVPKRLDGYEVRAELVGRFRALRGARPI